MRAGDDARQLLLNAPVRHGNSYIEGNREMDYWNIYQSKSVIDPIPEENELPRGIKDRNPPRTTQQAPHSTKLFMKKAEQAAGYYHPAKA
jgi:hypothetical protein